jgi:SAM-dependent methyltransferase
MRTPVFKEYAKYYDLLYRTKDYAGEIDYVVRTLRQRRPDAQAVLEFGSGTGRHGRLLAAQGFKVFGVELSETMAAAAHAARERDAALQAAGGSFDCMQGDIRNAKVDGTFDAVLALFHVVSYQTTNQDLIQTFENAARHLRSGGIFLFDVWHGPAVLTERPAVRIKRVEDDELHVTRLAEPELKTSENVVVVRYTMFAESKPAGQLAKFSEEHRMRYLFPVEIELLASRCGFAMESHEEFLTGNPINDRTWGVAYVLRKI